MTISSKDEAIERFKVLVARYGLQWTASVPREAYLEMDEVNKFLSERDRRAALGLPTK
jgi:hypothetical protein